MSDYISKSAVLEIIDKEIDKEVSDVHQFIVHNTQLAIRHATLKLPTVDEKEIIRKAFERVVERLNEIISNLDNKNKICMDIGDFKSSDRYSDRMCEVIKCKEIVMEEGGIE